MSLSRYVTGWASGWLSLRLFCWEEACERCGLGVMQRSVSQRGAAAAASCDGDAAPDERRFLGSPLAYSPRYGRADAGADRLLRLNGLLVSGIASYGAQQSVCLAEPQLHPGVECCNFTARLGRILFLARAGGRRLDYTRRAGHFYAAEIPE